MLGLFISNAYAMGGSTGAGGQDVPWYAQPFIPLLIILGVFYFFLLAPQKKERKKLEEKLSNIKVGDKVITSGGIHGIVANAGGDPVKVKIADNVKIDVSRSAIVSVQSGGSAVEEKS